MENIDVMWVLNEVEIIEACKSDFEAAHGREDNLYKAVLSAIATGSLDGPDARDCASAALTARDIKFARHCA